MPNTTYGNIEVYYTTQFIETDDSFKFDLSSITKIDNNQMIYFHPNFTLFKINCTNPGQVQLNFFDEDRYPDIVWGKRLVYLEENTNYNLRINAYDFSIFLPPMNDYTTIYDKNNNTFLEPDKLIEVHSTSSSSSYSNLHTNKGVSLLAVNTYYSIEQLNNITNEFEWIDNSTGTASIINDNYGFFYSIPEVDNWTHLEVWIETPNNLCGVFSYYGIYNSSKMIFTPITFDLYESTVFATTHHIYVQNAALFTKDKNKHYFISFGVYDLCLNVNIKIKYHRKLNKFGESLSQFNNIPFIINKEHFNKPYIFDNISKEEESTNILLLEKKCSKTDELSLYYNSIFSSQLAKDYSLNTEYKKIEIKTNEYIQLGINEIKKANDLYSGVTPPYVMDKVEIPELLSKDETQFSFDFNTTKLSWKGINNSKYELVITKSIQNYKEYFDNECFFLDETPKENIDKYVLEETFYPVDLSNGTYMVNIIAKINTPINMTLAYSSSILAINDNFYEDFPSLSLTSIKTPIVYISLPNNSKWEKIEISVSKISNKSYYKLLSSDKTRKVLLSSITITGDIKEPSLEGYTIVFDNPYTINSNEEVYYYIMLGFDGEYISGQEQAQIKYVFDNNSNSIALITILIIVIVIALVIGGFFLWRYLSKKTATKENDVHYTELNQNGNI